MTDRLERRAMNETVRMTDVRSTQEASPMDGDADVGVF
jgi:hypothetical protein